MIAFAGNPVRRRTPGLSSALVAGAVFLLLAPAAKGDGRGSHSNEAFGEESLDAASEGLGEESGTQQRLINYVPPTTHDAVEKVLATTAVGSSSPPLCDSFCITDSNGNCGQPGIVTVKSPVNPPFQAKNFRKCPSNVSSCAGPAVTLPATLNGNEDLCFDLVFSPTNPFTARDILVIGRTTVATSHFDYYLYGTAPNPFNCQENDTTACLNKGRFRLTAKFATTAGALQTAHVVRQTADTAYLWFFNADNVEAQVKVINGCGLNSRYWVFAAGLTNVRVVITITDTKNNTVRTIENPLGTPFSPIQNTNAFATCP